MRDYGATASDSSYQRDALYHASRRRSGFISVPVSADADRAHLPGLADRALDPPNPSGKFVDQDSIHESAHGVHRNRKRRASQIRYERLAMDIQQQMQAILEGSENKPAHSSGKSYRAAEDSSNFANKSRLQSPTLPREPATFPKAVLSQTEKKFMRLSHFTIAETQQYHFAVILDSGTCPHTRCCGVKRQLSPEDVYDNEMKAKQNLMDTAQALSLQGISVSLLFDSMVESDKDPFILLCSISHEALDNMQVAMKFNRWLRSYSGGHLLDCSTANLTAAQKLQNGEMIIRHQAGVEEGKNGVLAVLPVDCYEFQRSFMTMFISRMNPIEYARAIFIVAARQCYSFLTACSSSFQYLLQCFGWKQNWYGHLPKRPPTPSDQGNLGGKEDMESSRANLDRFDDEKEPPQPPGNMASREAWTLPKEERVLLDLDFYVHELRRHYGSKIAIYFAYIHAYTNFLVFPALLGVGISVGGLIWGDAWYGKATAVYGLAMCSIIAPLWLKMWRRKSKELKAIWFASNQSGTLKNPEIEYPNPGYDPRVGVCGRCCFRRRWVEVVEEARLPDSVRKRAEFCRRLPVLVLLGLFLVVMITLMLGVTAVLVHVYIKIKSAPTCFSAATMGSPANAEESGLCFSPFTRWLAILAQGIVLGLVVDIFQLSLLMRWAKFFNQLENYPTQDEYDDNFIKKLYAFDWLSVYFWYFTLSFLYVPFGAQWAAFVEKHLGPQWSFDASNDKFDLRDAFITPLVVTQLLNFIIDNLVPYFFNRVVYLQRKEHAKSAIKLRAVRWMRKHRSSIFSYEREGALLLDENQAFEAAARAKALAAAELARELTAHCNRAWSSRRESSSHKCRFRSDNSVRRSGKDTPSSEITAASPSSTGHKKPPKQLIRAVPDCGPRQPTFLDLVVSSEKKQYTSYHDYNDMVLQYGYVVMFSVVWPWIPLCCLVNNMFEMRGDAFNLMYSHRRAVPREAANIGQWESCIQFVNYSSLLLNVILICLSTGQLEWFFAGCHEAYVRMGPDFECLPSLIERACYGAILENVGLGLFLLVTWCISDTPSWISDRVSILKQAAEDKANFALLRYQELDNNDR